MEACFSGPSLALLAAIWGVISIGFGALWFALNSAQKAHIKTLQDQNAELTDMLKPSIGMTSNALQTVARERRARRGDT